VIADGESLATGRAALLEAVKNEFPRHLPFRKRSLTYRVGCSVSPPPNIGERRSARKHRARKSNSLLSGCCQA